MAKNTTIYQVTRPLEVAEEKGFAFTKKEDKFGILSERRKEYIEKVNGLKPIWIVMSIVLIGALIGLGIYEAFTAKTAIAGLIDPSGEGYVPDWVLTTIGASLAIIGMMIGHSIFENVEEDGITGRRTLRAMFYLSLIGALVYVGLQYFIVKAAGNGEEDFKFLPYLVVAIAVLELIVGGLLLSKVITYLLIFVLALRLGALTRGMRRNSRSTNNSYRDYRAYRDVYNTQNPTAQLELEGNDNIRRAIAYYGGINLNNIDNNAGSTEENHPAPNEMQKTNNQQAENNAQNKGRTTTEEEIEGFLNDDSDNLTF
ncbi:MAG: hypothetical protein QY315_04950 [Saprospiraceae bacterium]|jgi:hypothetical protein|nr:MAG: hypothetical protein QY315_04950 [Saprospiraceae bacterium]